MDPYEIIGVARNATHDEINVAWRAAAKRLHPDHNKSPDAAAEFQRAMEAANLLLDPHRRSLFDMGAGDDARLVQLAIEEARAAIANALRRYTMQEVSMRIDIGVIIRNHLRQKTQAAELNRRNADTAIKNTKRLLRIANGGMLSAMLEENLRDAEKGVERARLESEALRWAQRLVAREGFDWSKDEPEHGLLTLTNALQQWTSEDA